MVSIEAGRAQLLGANIHCEPYRADLPTALLAAGWPCIIYLTHSIAENIPWTWVGCQDGTEQRTKNFLLAAHCCRAVTVRRVDSAMTSL